MVKSLFQLTVPIMLLLGIALLGCNRSMVIERVNYAQPIESVVSPNDQGVVDDVQQGIQFNILPLQYIETQDTSSVTVDQVRYIRGKEGFYYITASGFSNIFVMAPEESRLKLENKITVAEQGLGSPALNQRGEYIQLVDRETGNSWRLNAEGIQETQSENTNSEGNQS